MQELPDELDPSCAGSFPALPREAGRATPQAPEPLARGSLSTLRPAAPRFRASAPAPASPTQVHAAAQVQQFRRVGRAHSVVAAALLALVAGGLAGLAGLALLGLL